MIRIDSNPIPFHSTFQGGKLINKGTHGFQKCRRDAWHFPAADARLDRLRAEGKRGISPEDAVTVTRLTNEYKQELDLLANNMELPVAQVGDLIVVFQSGAYGLTASPTAFLSHPAPTEVLV